MKAPKNPSTKKQEKQLLADGYTLEEAKQIIAEREEFKLRDTLRARKATLDALDTTEFKSFQDSAHCNACDTCREQGESSDEYGIPYLQSYIATISMVFDEAGIAH